MSTLTVMRGLTECGRDYCMFLSLVKGQDGGNAGNDGRALAWDSMQHSGVQLGQRCRLPAVAARASLMASLRTLELCREERKEGNPAPLLQALVVQELTDNYTMHRRLSRDFRVYLFTDLARDPKVVLEGSREILASFKGEERE